MISKRVVLISLLTTLTLSAENAAQNHQFDDILSELKKIRELLENQRGPVRAEPIMLKLDVGESPMLGAKEAPLTIVEFTDYQCPYCRQFHRQTYRDIEKLLVDPGKVRFYVMNLPLEKHSNALLAAQAGKCSGEQGKFWQMHDKMQASADDPTIDKLIEYGETVGLRTSELKKCIESGKYKETIQNNVHNIAEKGIRGTPAFIIGKSTQGGVEGELVIGAIPFGMFEQKLKLFEKQLIGAR